MPTTAPLKKSKLLTVLLAFLFGSVGAHRFYLKGGRDFWAWTQVAAMALGIVGVVLLWSTHRSSLPGWACAIIGGASVLTGFLSALVYGLRPMTGGTRSSIRTARRHARAGRSSCSPSSR